MTTQQDNLSKRTGLVWLFAAILSLFCVFSTTSLAQVPGCNTSVKDLLRKIPNVPAISDLKGTLELGTDLLGMADGDIFDRLGEISPLLDKIHPDKLTEQLGSIDSTLDNPGLQGAGVMGGMIEGVLGDSGLPAFDAKLRTVYDAANKKRKEKKKEREDKGETEESAEEKELTKTMNKSRELIESWTNNIGNFRSSVDKSQKDLADKIKNSAEMGHLTKAQDLLDKAANPALAGNDIIKLLNNIKGLNLGEIGRIKRQFDEICGMLPNHGDLQSTITSVLSGYADGLLQDALDTLTQKALDGLDSLVDKLGGTGAVAAAAKGAARDLANGDVDGAIDTLKDAGVKEGTDAARDALSQTGALGQGAAAAAAIAACKIERASEKFDCPEVDCDANLLKKGVNSGSRRFQKRIQDYFEYTPPKDNRPLYLNKRYHDYDVNKKKERRVEKGFEMASVPCAGNEDQISEPCQDNRWRDQCLIGRVYPDNPYLLEYKNRQTVKGNEEPWPGVNGSSPIYKKDSATLNCIVPKNTERKSTLELDNGWRHRDMCPGSSDLERSNRGSSKRKYEDTMDMLSGAYGCIAPVPKCDLNNDWKLDSIQWKNSEYGSYARTMSGFFSNLLNNLTGGILGTEQEIWAKLQEQLSSEQMDAIKKTLDTQWSKRAECKPAYWARLMLDSCANRYILSGAMDPNDLVNKDGGTRKELSPRYCQPFKAVRIAEEEYDVGTYLQRSVDGLLKEDYMPWVEYDRQLPDDRSKEAEEVKRQAREYREKEWPERMIKWRDVNKFTMNDNKEREQYLAIKKKTDTSASRISIDDYISHPVERIVDPMHPFSPRYDVTERLDGTLVTDRNVFDKQMESKARATPWVVPIPGIGVGLETYSCVPDGKKGYFEFGCTIYCSAVEVDLLRFRYKDYRLCMGCQIDTNEKAFWDEYEANQKHYITKYCVPPTTVDGCEYGFYNAALAREYFR